MNDVRTPTTYFQERGASPEAINKLKSKLDDLLVSLYEYKERFQTTPAEDKILDAEIDKAEFRRYKKVSKEYASKVAEAFIHGTPDDVVDAITEALDYKVSCRVEPFMVKAGEEMEEKIFWDLLYNHNSFIQDADDENHRKGFSTNLLLNSLSVMSTTQPVVLFFVRETNP